MPQYLSFRHFFRLLLHLGIEILSISRLRILTSIVEHSHPPGESPQLGWGQCGIRAPSTQRLTLLGRYSCTCMAVLSSSGQPALTCAFLQHQPLTTAFPRSKTLAISYRLASKNSSCAFPAALQDTLTAYIYLLQQGILAQRIILATDSAGCNLAIGLLRYPTSTHGSAVQLPLPKGAILCSPWIDVYAARSGTRELESLFRNIRTDYVPVELQLWGARSYIPISAKPEVDPYVSPIHHPFFTSTPLWVIVGGGEIPAEEGSVWAREMEQVGCRVQVDVVRLANHAILGVGGIMGLKVEAEKTIGRARE